MGGRTRCIKYEKVNKKWNFSLRLKTVLLPKLLRNSYLNIKNLFSINIRFMKLHLLVFLTIKKLIQMWIYIGVRFSIVWCYDFQQTYFISFSFYNMDLSFPCGSFNINSKEYKVLDSNECFFFSFLYSLLLPFYTSISEDMFSCLFLFFFIFQSNDVSESIFFVSAHIDIEGYMDYQG